MLTSQHGQWCGAIQSGYSIRVSLLRHTYKYLLSLRLLSQVVLLVTQLSAVHVTRRSQLARKLRRAHVCGAAETDLVVIFFYLQYNCYFLLALDKCII